MTWGQVKILTSPLWVNGGNIEILPNASVRCNSFRIMCLIRPFMMNQGQVLTSDPAKVVWGHRGHQQVFADNLRLRRARDMKVVSMCLSRQYASTDMQLASSRDLDLRSNFDFDLSRSCYACFDASWRGKHDGVKIIALSFQTQKLSLKNCFAQKCRFWPFVTSDA